MTTAPTSPLTAALTGRLTTNARATLAHLADHPDDGTARGALADELRDASAWDWPTVRDLVLDAPACDGRRLLAADWFEEAGEGERAEFVRVQVELSRTPANIITAGQFTATRDGRVVPLDPCDDASTVTGIARVSVPNPRHAELLRRERELLDGLHSSGVCLNQTAWSSPLGQFVLPRRAEEVYSWSRGFVGSVTTEASVWLAFGDTIVAGHPVTTVTLPGWMDWLRANWEETEAAVGIAPPALGSQIMEAHLRQRWPRVTTWHLPPAAHVWDGVEHRPEFRVVIGQRDGSRSVQTVRLHREAIRLAREAVAARGWATVTQQRPLMDTAGRLMSHEVIGSWDYGPVPRDPAPYLPPGTTPEQVFHDEAV